MTARAPIRLRRALIAMSALAVIGDSILVPFYPQVFAARYGMSDPAFVGLYLAACCGVVTLALPAWARWAGGAPPLRLLVWTQGGAGVLAILSAQAPTIGSFWVASLAMFALKASYLLIYPYLMSLRRGEDHARDIGTLAVVVHVGAIAGAAVGGSIVQTGIVSTAFYVMAAGDFAQMALCLRLKPAGTIAVRPPSSPSTKLSTPVLRLCAAMLVFCFVTYMTRPFFALRWIAVSGLSSPALSGLVYALPAAIALAGLALNRQRGTTVESLDQTIGRLAAIGAAGLLLQAAPNVAALLVGRCFYGWSLFQMVVALDGLLFRASTPALYARDFSVANAAQNLGVMGGSLAAGAIVPFGAAMPFLGGAAIVALTPLVLMRRARRGPLKSALEETFT